MITADHVIDRASHTRAAHAKDSRRKTLDWYRIAALAVLAAGTAVAQSAKEETDEQPLVLSPFTITEGKDVGYAATSTLAGTRIKTDLKDLGASISVVTAEFLADTAATDAGQLLSYTANSEVGGLQGNFSGATDASNGRYYQNDARTDPQFNQRIRGIGEAALTRGYFRTEIPFDTYNTDSVTISRGPNSLLFGIGSPGGIINNSLKQPIFGKNHVEITARYGSHGSMRGEVDFNQELIKGRLAARINSMYDDEKFQQKPTWERDKRVYGALELVLFNNTKSDVLGPTILKANGEAGKVNGSPVEIVPPSIAYSNWFMPYSKSYQRYTGIAPPATVVSPAEGGTWQFQTTFNPFLINVESGINTAVHPAYFRTPAIIYGSANSAQPSIGLSGPDRLGEVSDLSQLQGYLAAAQWNANRDTVASVGLSGTPGVQPLVDAAGGNPAAARMRPHQLYATNHPYAEGYAPGFAVPTLQDRDIFDYHNLIYSGGIDRVDKKFEARNIALEQTFFNNQVGVEFAYDRQAYESHQDFLFSGGDPDSAGGPYDVQIDINQYLLNGLPNPNLGRAYTRVPRVTLRNARWERETARATIFGEYDFGKKHSGWLKWLGRHRVVGLFSDDTYDTFKELLYDSWNSTTENIASIANDNTLTFGRRRLRVGVYTSPSLLGVPSMDDIRLQQINIRRPQPGDSYEILYADVGAATADGRRVRSGQMQLVRAIGDQSVQRQTIESRAVSWQSYLFSDHIVGLLGARKDRTASYDRKTEAQLGFSPYLADGTWDPAATQLTDEPVFTESGTTVTSSLIARFPEKLLFKLPWSSDLQFHFAKSENFNPIGLRNDALGRPIAQPTGETKEYGFLLTVLDQRVNIRFNVFKTILQNVNAGSSINVGEFYLNNVNRYLTARRDGIPFSAARTLVGIEPWPSNITTYEQFFTAFDNAIPSELRAAINPTYRDSDGNGVADLLIISSISNQGATTDRVAKGYELEVTANLTRNWRLLMNVSRQETVQNNTAPVDWPIAEQFLKSMQDSGILPLLLDPTGTGLTRSIGSQWMQGDMSTIRSMRAKDGVQVNEQREWRATAVSKYTFSSGLLKGFGLGGAARWESKGVTGYETYLLEGNVPVPNVAKPFYDDGLFSADAFLSYERRLFGRYDWRIQFNVRNAIGSQDDIPVKTNPDGQVAVIRIPNPQVWTVSNSIRF